MRYLNLQLAASTLLDMIPIKRLENYFSKTGISSCLHQGFGSFYYLNFLKFVETLSQILYASDYIR